MIDAVGDPRATVVYARSQRRLSATQLAAAHRELARREQRAQSQQEVERIEADERAVLDSWRECTAVLRREDYDRALHARPFVTNESAPPNPNYVIAEAELADRIIEDVRSSSARTMLSRFAGAGVALAVAVVSLGVLRVAIGKLGAMHDIAALCVGLVLGLVTERLARQRWERDTKRLAESRLAAEWPRERDRLEADYEQQAAAYSARDAQARAEWDEAEAARVAWATALVQGDLATIEQAVLESLDEIDFPFEADCTVAASDAANMFVNLDLPEIEDVIPVTRFNVLKSGALKEVKRKAEDRNAAYAQLVCGLVLCVAVTVLSTAPTVQAVTVAAYTQRKRRGAADIEDAYVIESRVTRLDVEAIDVKRCEAVKVLGQLQTRFEWASNLAFKKIAAPAWLGETSNEIGPAGD